jgi:hypothetical protein
MSWARSNNKFCSSAQMQGVYITDFNNDGYFRQDAH